MSTYADAAASSGPIGAKKLPSPPELEKTTNPAGSVGVVNEKEFKEFEDKVKKEVKKDAKKAKKDLKNLSDKVNDESSKIYSSLKVYLQSIGNYLSNAGASINANTSNALSKTSVELQNPVVLIQTLVGLGGLAAGYVVYLERSKILSNHKSVIATHSAIVTGLIALDGYLFNKFYPKYDRKSKKL